MSDVMITIGLPPRQLPAHTVGANAVAASLPVQNGVATAIACHSVALSEIVAPTLGASPPYGNIVSAPDITTPTIADAPSTPWQNALRMFDETQRGTNALQSHESPLAFLASAFGVGHTELVMSASGCSSGEGVALGLGGLALLVLVGVLMYGLGKRNRSSETPLGPHIPPQWARGPLMVTEASTADLRESVPPRRQLPPPPRIRPSSGLTTAMALDPVFHDEEPSDHGNRSGVPTSQSASPIRPQKARRPSGVAVDFDLPQVGRVTPGRRAKKRTMQAAQTSLRAPSVPTPKRPVVVLPPAPPRPIDLSASQYVTITVHDGERLLQLRRQYGKRSTIIYLLVEEFGELFLLATNVSTASFASLRRLVIGSAKVEAAGEIGQINSRTFSVVTTADATARLVDAAESEAVEANQRGAVAIAAFIENALEPLRSAARAAAAVQATQAAAVAAHARAAEEERRLEEARRRAAPPRPVTVEEALAAQLRGQEIFRVRTPEAFAEIFRFRPYQTIWVMVQCADGTAELRIPKRGSIPDLDLVVRSHKEMFLGAGHAGIDPSDPAGPTFTYDGIAQHFRMEEDRLNGLDLSVAPRAGFATVRAELATIAGPGIRVRQVHLVVAPDRHRATPVSAAVVIATDMEGVRKRRFPEAHPFPDAVDGLIHVPNMKVAGTLGGLLDVYQLATKAGWFAMLQWFTRNGHHPFAGVSFAFVQLGGRVVAMRVVRGIVVQPAQMLADARRVMLSGDIMAGNGKSGALGAIEFTIGNLSSSEFPIDKVVPPWLEHLRSMTGDSNAVRLQFRTPKLEEHVI